MEVAQDAARLSFISNFKTNNMIIDVIISMLIATMIGNVYTIRYKIIDYLDKLYSLLTGKYKNVHLCFDCTEYLSAYGGGKIRMNGSDTFKALMFYLRENIKNNKTSGLKHLKEFNISSGDDYFEHDKNHIDESIKETLYIVNQQDAFYINSHETKDLYFKMTKSETENDDKKKDLGRMCTYTLIISSKSNDLQYLQQFVDQICEDYYNKMEAKINGNLYVFSYEGRDGDGNIKYTTYPFYTTCGIDKVYFKDKDKVLSQINFFKDNKQWYEKQGKPYTLGICTYGPPGCGKTSWEKSLAKYLDRHMIIVDFSKIKSQSEADEIFFDEKINGKIIPYDKRLYVFPDFDRMSDLVYDEKYSKDNEIKNLLNDYQLYTKTNNKAELSHDNVSEILKFLQVNLDSEYTHLPGPKDSKPNSVPLNLSKLLNIFDGVPERTGQIIMMSANHPEKIDRAILRPGRVDILIHFDLALKDDLVNMVKNYFYKDISKIDNYVKNNDISSLDKKWTPAEIFQICSKNTSYLQTFSQLISKNRVNSFHFS
tara:strand:- start:2894 stop:4510 length:1617 start_codon:yes stop_codon:yes gene_type:complete